jgi:hypothetical protein
MDDDGIKDLLKKHKLQGKINYFDWKRQFTRVAKAKGLWPIYSGEERQLPEPKEEDYWILTDGTYYSDRPAKSGSAAKTRPYETPSKIPQPQSSASSARSDKPTGEDIDA